MNGRDKDSVPEIAFVGGGDPKGLARRTLWLVGDGVVVAATDGKTVEILHGSRIEITERERKMVERLARERWRGLFGKDGPKSSQALYRAVDRKTRQPYGTTLGMLKDMERRFVWVVFALVEK